MVSVRKGVHFTCKARSFVGNSDLNLECFSLYFLFLFFLLQNKSDIDIKYFLLYMIDPKVTALR